MRTKPLLITLTALATGTAGAVILYPRITMSNDEAQARQDMQQILAAVREYRTENNGKFPAMEDLPADVPRRAPLSYWSGDSAARRKGMGPLYSLLISDSVLKRLELYNEKTPFDPSKEPILYINGLGNTETKSVTREYIQAPGKYVVETRQARLKLVGFLDGRIEKMWTPTPLEDTIRVLNTWGIGDDR
jgi:hypothetical protein